ncbi:MAG TPA: ABC transporter ATP-binding protein [Pseudonocardiaceae bacterium]|nr:ABC transporter ATP-binding protein [Pseudonocardiaceae bacterium]
MSITRAAVVPGVSARGERTSGREAWRLLWRTDRPLSVLVICWVIGGALLPGLVVTALGVVVGLLPGAIRDGLGSGSGHRLVVALVVAALIYAVSLVLDPIGNALGTAASSRITGDLQGRLLASVSQPVGVGHLEDARVLDRLASAEGSLTGYFPGDAPVTWVGTLASRVSGIIGCVVVSVFVWWLGLVLLVMWLAVRRYVLGAVIRQATELRGQTTVMRRAWYFIGVGSKARDAKEIRVFGLANFVAARFRREYREAMRSAAGGLRDLHRRAGLCFVVVLAGYAVALAVIANDARTHAIGIGALAILLPMLSVTMTAGTVNYDDITLAWTLAGLPDVDRLESDLAAADLSGVQAVGGRPERSVRLESVSFRYPTGTTEVLAGVDLELPAGTSTAIVGVNGAGKSTLVSLLSRLRDPTGGRITVDGTDVRELDPGGWQRTVAIMPQEPTHYPVSAYDNVVFGALEHRDDRTGVDEAARLAGFADVVPTLPEGWDTLLARELPGGVSLSGGQWQRLALARALFATRHGARLLVLDEPTAALDVRGEAQFYGRFLDITRGLTTVIISHRFATVRRADAICVLDGGVIAEHGTHDELVALGGTYARMYEVQAARFGS